MNHVKNFFIFFILISFYPSFSQNSKDFKTLTAYLEKARKQWKIPGMAVGIVQGDQLIYSKGFGVGKIGEEATVDENTIFAIASNTKAFTATALGLLVEEKKIKWDDKVSDYLKDFKLKDGNATDKITIRDLLCHKIGFQTWAGDLTWYASSNDRSQVIHRMRYQNPTFDFKTGYGYSNLAFLVAGEIIPKITNESWDDFIRNKLFVPLEMDRSSTTINAFLGLDNIASPHTMYNDELVVTPYRHVDNVGPAASINSCVTDLSKWLRMQMNNGQYKDQQIVSDDILFETHKPHNLLSVSKRSKEINPFTNFKTYGLGWEVLDYHGKKVCQHSGGMDGMLSRVSFMPDEKLGIIILTNSDENWLISFMQYYIYDQLLGVPGQDWNQLFFDIYQERKQKKLKQKHTANPSLKPSVDHGELVGTYENELYGKARVTIKNDQLHIALSAHPNMCKSIEHYEGDTYLVHWNDKIWNQSKLHFDIESQVISSLRFQIRPEWIDPLEYVFEKINE